MSAWPALALLALVAGGQPTLLTHEPGDATEAAWSPDGRTLVYQCAGPDGRGLRLLDLAGGPSRALVSGPGEALHPAWSPDGRSVVYAWSRPDRTIFNGLTEGCNLWLVPATGGEPRRLTSGLVRDYVPAFSADGRTVYFSSTRAVKNSAVGLWRLPLDAAGAPEPVLVRDVDDAALVQPSLSPDGRFMAYGCYTGHRGNWTIQLARTDRPERRYSLTEPDWACYGPRWSPDGRWLACTGYRPGDPGWGLYVVQVRTGGWLRLDVGEGNSRSPSWSPDGRELVYENNRSGHYQLYRLAPQLPAELPAPAAEPAGPPRTVLDLRFTDGPQTRVPDHSGQGNDGRPAGPLTWADGALAFAPGSAVTVPQPRGCDFGRGAFSVRAELLVERHTHALRLIVSGDYPGNRRGWQLYLDDQDRLWFNSRTPDLSYVGAVTSGPLPTGRRLTVVGVRDRRGAVELYVDGVAQAGAGVGATVAYPAPTQVCVGQQYDGTMPAVGLRLYRVEVHRGALLTPAGEATTLEEFLRS